LSVIRTRMPSILVFLSLNTLTKNQVTEMSLEWKHSVVPNIVLLLSYLEFELMNRMDTLTSRLKHPPRNMFYNITIRKQISIFIDQFSNVLRTGLHIMAYKI
jgi:hypothetical protein